MPPPGSIELREFCSPVPAQTCIVSDGATASAPIELTGLSSNVGRNVTPPFVLFQTPPAAGATKSVLDGNGMPVMSAIRPSKWAGPTLRHRMPASVVESTPWAARAAGAARRAGIRSRVSTRIANAVGWSGRPVPQTVGTNAIWRALRYRRWEVGCGRTLRAAESMGIGFLPHPTSHIRVMATATRKPPPSPARTRRHR